MTILDEAKELTASTRQKYYGSPIDNWTRTAVLWSAVLGVQVTAEQAAMCMIAVKLAREANRPKRDNRVDIAGYAEVLDQIVQAREKEARRARRSSRRPR